MSLKELESTVAQLLQNEKAELLRFLTRELRQSSATENAPKAPVTPADRTRWLQNWIGFAHSPLPIRSVRLRKFWMNFVRIGFDP